MMDQQQPSFFFLFSVAAGLFNFMFCSGFLGAYTAFFSYGFFSVGLICLASCGVEFDSCFFSSGTVLTFS